MIKAVLFDLGRVIVPFDFNIGYAKLEARCGISASEIPGRIGRTGLVSQLEKGHIESRDFVRQLSEQLKLDITYEEFAEIWCSIFLPDTLIPETMLLGIAENYRLILLSNTNSIHFEMVVEHYPLLRHFHTYVLSYKEGSMKPEPLIYQRAIEAADCLPGECFFTDDIQANVDAAKEQGIDAVLFESATQIERELRQRDVTWNYSSRRASTKP